MAASRGKTLVQLALKKISSSADIEVPSTSKCSKVRNWLNHCQEEKKDSTNYDSGGSGISDPNDFEYVPKSDDSESETSCEDLPPFCDPAETCFPDGKSKTHEQIERPVYVQDESSMPSSIVYPIINDANTAETSLTPDQANIIKQLPVLPDNTSQTQKPKVKPKRPCFFCSQTQSQLLRHLQTVHKDQPEVKQAIVLPKCDRNKAFNMIKKKGIMVFNLKLKSEGKELLRERRQGDQNLSICNGCQGFYSKRRIAKHQKQCEPCKGVQSSSLRLNVNYLGDESKDDEFRNQILCKFRSDETGKLCKTDAVIIRLGRKLWAKRARKERRVIMNDMRTLGNLIVELRKVAQDDKLEGKDIFNRDNFDHLTKAIQNMTYTETGALKPGLKLAIGFLLKKLIKVMKGCYIQEKKPEEGEEVDKFSALLELEWEFIFYRAQLMCEQRRQNLRKPGDMPLERDLTTFRNYIIERTSQLTSDSFSKWDHHDFIEMRNLLVSRLTLFNARRGGEPARMLLSEWKEAENSAWIDNQRVDCVTDPFEKELINDMKLAYQAGKGSRRLVPVLFPKDTLAPIRKLIDEREECGVSEDNPFLFPNTGMSNDHVIGWNSIQNVAKKIGNELEKPALLTADKFRHRTSTLFASLEMPIEKREAFYRHMGHSEGINRDVYQCPLALTEITEVGSFLNTLDKNATQSIPNERVEQELTKATNNMNRENVLTNSDNYGGQEVDEEHVLEDSEMAIHLEKRKRELQHTRHNQMEGLSVDATLLSQEPKTKSRRYRRWSQIDTAKVTSFFAEFIDDIYCSTTSKGSLPSKKSVEDFLKTNTVFLNEDISHKELVTLIKTKVFNERKTKRESALKLKVLD